MTPHAALPMPADFIPLSTMVNIVRSRNAASIYPPLAVTAIANGTMWTVYGLAVAVSQERGLETTIFTAPEVH